MLYFALRKSFLPEHGDPYCAERFARLSSTCASYPVKNGKKGDFEDADYILASIHKIGKDEMDRAKNLKLIHVPATGYNHVDLEYAKQKGIPVCNSNGENATTTAEFTIALMLACMRRLSMIDRRCKQGEWHSWTWRHDSYELRDKVIGIVGGGNIGRMVLQRLQGWECKDFLYYDPYPMPKELEEKLHCRRVDPRLPAARVRRRLPALPADQGYPRSYRRGAVQHDEAQRHHRQ